MPLKFGGKEVVLLVDLEQSPGCLVIEMQDKGIGLSPAFVASGLFRKYCRDVSPSSTAQGTGLGLNICKRLCDAMGADLTYRRNGNRGSIFSICIRTDTQDAKIVRARSLISLKPAVVPSIMSSAPVTFESEGSTEIEFLPEAEASKIDVLLVDDVPINLKVLHNYWSRLGNVREQFGEITVAEDGVHALELLLKRVRAKQPAPLLCILDVQMPLLTGCHTAKHWRAIEADLPPEIPRCYLVAMSASPVPLESLPLFDTQLSKPVAFESFQRMINGLLAKE